MYQEAEALHSQLMVIVRMLRVLVASDLAEVRLTSRQLSVIEAIIESGGITVNELARSLGLAHSTVSDIAERLVRRNLIERWPDPEDQRKVWLDLTDEVRQMFADGKLPQAYHPVARMLARATPEQRGTIAAGLGLMDKLLRDQWLIDRSRGKRRRIV